jgi:hypothetical protein
VSERPILFSALMVRALLAGTKTQTRRAVNMARWRLADGSEEFAPPASACPYGALGDRLWVREAFRFPSSLDKESPATIGERAIDAGYNRPWCPTRYEADGARTSTWSSFHTPPTDTVPGRLRAGMHMPRWASRITLEVVSVRVERLQDISEADAIAEGVHPDAGGRHDDDAAGFHRIGPVRGDSFPIARYAALWESINGHGSWAANPWVWCVEFRRLP